MRAIEKPKTEFQAWFYKNLCDNNLTFTDVAGLLRTTKQTISNHYRKEESLSFAYIWCYCALFGNGNPDTLYEMTRSK